MRKSFYTVLLLTLFLTAVALLARAGAPLLPFCVLTFLAGGGVRSLTACLTEELGV